MSIAEKLWGTGKKVSQDEVLELTNQFYVTLRAYFAKIKQDAQVRNKEAFDRIELLLDPERSAQNWTHAYEIEQLVVHLFNDETITTELSVRLLEARSILRPELATMYETQFREIEKSREDAQSTQALATLGERRRTLLARLINDLQWRYIVNEATRRYSKLITRRTAILSVAALVTFVFVIVVGIAQEWLRFEYGDIHLLWVAGLAGTWGATFSMLASLKNRLVDTKFDDLKLMKAFTVLMSRAAIGAGAACILFFFLSSGLLAGSAFPSLTEPRVVPSETPRDPDALTPTEPQRPRELPHTELALLIVWCFLAGFSEQLIPGLLASTEARAASAGASTTDRFRPTTGTTEVPAGAAENPGSRPETRPPTTTQGGENKTGTGDTSG